MTKKYRVMLQKRYVLLFLITTSLFLVGQFSAAIAAPTRQGEDIALITSPANNAVVQGTVEIVGSADHPAFQFYIIEFHPEPVTNDQWQIIGTIHEAPVLNGVLESWNTTLYPDGSYTLRLRVVRQDGNYSEFFSQQVVIANAQPLPTDTPTITPTPAQVVPTATPTDLPPTPTIVIDQPIVETPTPRPVVPTSPPLEDPDETGGRFIPTVSGFSVSPLRDACLYGGGLMLGVFLLFGFFSALRAFVMNFINRRRQL